MVLFLQSSGVKENLLAARRMKVPDVSGALIRPNGGEKVVSDTNLFPWGGN